MCRNILRIRGVLNESEEMRSELRLSVPDRRSDDKLLGGTQSTQHVPYLSTLGPNVGSDAAAGAGGSHVLFVAPSALTRPPAIQQEKSPQNCIYFHGSSDRGQGVRERSLTHFNGALDLQALIEYLAMSAVCIGPGPAMRRADVDIALMHSLARY
jgi:hypothetical protein